MAYTAKSETGATWAARMDDTTLRNWSAAQLYDFSSILPNSYFNYGRYMNGMDFSKISNDSSASKAGDGRQAGMFKQYHNEYTYNAILDVTDYTDYWPGLDPAAVTSSSAYWLQRVMVGKLACSSSTTTSTPTTPSLT